MLCTPQLRSALVESIFSFPATPCTEKWKAITRGLKVEQFSLTKQLNQNRKFNCQCNSFSFNTVHTIQRVCCSRILACAQCKVIGYNAGMPIASTLDQPQSSTDNT